MRKRSTGPQQIQSERSWRESAECTTRNCSSRKELLMHQRRLSQLRSYRCTYVGDKSTFAFRSSGGDFRPPSSMAASTARAIQNIRSSTCGRSTMRMGSTTHALQYDSSHRGVHNQHPQCSSARIRPRKRTQKHPHTCHEQRSLC
jgi:hypothetical protein